MNVILTIQMLSALVAKMIRDAIVDNDMILFYHKTGMYNRLADLCEHCNLVVDIYNGRDGPHTRENGYERQLILCDVLRWFTNWKNMHKTVMLDDNSLNTEYNFFANETWFCSRALLLSHIGAIQMYSINEDEKVNPHNFLQVHR